jgi:hypothetical protein
MSERILLIDSDIFVLLSAAGLLDDLVDCLGFELSDVRRLDALPHQLQRGRSFRRYDEAARSEALTRCHEVRPIEDRPTSSEHWAKLISVDDIDEGEAFLFVKLAEASTSLLTTGDQRSLIALGKAEGLHSFRDQIRGRVVCLESALLLLVQNVGAQSVGEALQRLRSINTKIDVLFGYKNEFVEEEIVRQLRSYLKDLREKLGDDYLSEPPLSNA